MMPRVITEIEKRYDKAFPKNPATLFCPYDEEEQKPFLKLLEEAMLKNRPLQEEDLIAHFGKEIYAENKAMFEEYYGEIKW